MSIEEFWEGYTSSERDLFQRACRRLLKHTFIVRDKDEENKKAYYFISKKEGVKNFVSLEVHASLDKSSICRNLLSVLGIFCCRIFLLILL